MHDIVIPHHESTVHGLLILCFVSGLADSCCEDIDKLFLVHVCFFFQLGVQEHIDFLFGELVFQIEALKAAVFEVFTST